MHQPHLGVSAYQANRVSIVLAFASFFWRFTLLFPLLWLLGCSEPRPVSIDQPAREHLHLLPNAIPAQSVPAIPAVSKNLPYLPPPRQVFDEPLYSLSAIRAPLREVLFKLARDAKLELSILDDVSGQITIHIINQPLSVIIERLNEQTSLRLGLVGRLLTVRADSPYWVNYPINYVNLERFSASSILLANAVGSSQRTAASVQLGASHHQAQAASSLQIGSNVAILNRSQHEIWKTLSDGVMRILRSHYPMLAMPLLEGQTATPTSSQFSRNNKDFQELSQERSTAIAVGKDELMIAQPKVLPMPEQSLMRASSGSSFFPEGEPVSSYVMLAKEAGFMSVYATRKVHEAVQLYIDSMMMSIQRQVMIEATIVEVYLNDESQSGINWAALTSGFSLTQNYASSSDLAQRSGTTTLISEGRVSSDWNLNSTLNLLQRFGSYQVLSSPKIVGINNQPTLLKVVKNLVYFTTAVTPGSTSNGVTTPAVFATTPNTVPVGLVMSVLPSVDHHQQITLVVRPTISNLVGYVEDPNPEFKRVNVVSRVPEIQEREMESVLKLNDGQVAILGGLIQDEALGEDTGVPGLVTEPIWGYLFGQKNRQKRKTELVVFIRPTLIKHPDIETGDFSRLREMLDRNTTSKVPSDRQ